jgi:cytochrome P450
VTVTLDPFAPGFADNPYAQFRALREADPIHLTLTGAYALTRYDDVVRVLRDPDLSVERRDDDTLALLPPDVKARMDAQERRGGNRAILNIDPPDHHRIRRLVSKVFTPGAVEQMRTAVERLVAEALDAVAPAGEMDVIADLAFPLPFTVISEMLGMPEGRSRLELREWSGALVKTFDPIVTAEEWHAALDAGENMGAYVQEVIAAKRADPDDRLLSALVAIEDEGDQLTNDELVDNVILLFVAGHETTVNLIGNGVLALLRNRRELERLRADPDFDGNAVEELLRFESPVQASARIVRQPFDIDGHRFGPGDVLLTLLGAANHDPEHFGPDADVLDVGRANARDHVSFGGGYHHCLGAFLARLEGGVAVPTLLRRFPALEIATDAPAWNGRMVLRGLESLPVTL